MRKVRASIIAFHPIEFFSQKYSKKVFFVSTQITLECEICWCFKHRIWNIQNLPVSFHHFLLNSESAPQSYDHLNIFDGTFVQFCDYVVLPERYIYIYLSGEIRSVRCSNLRHLQGLNWYNFLQSRVRYAKLCIFGKLSIWTPQIRCQKYKIFFHKKVSITFFYFQLLQYMARTSILDCVSI